MINRVGEIHRDLQIIEELGGREVRCKCVKCGYADIYNKGNLVNHKTTCRKCYKNRLVNRVGEIFNNLQIMQELGNKKILAKCLLCNSEKEYQKATITSDKQKSCGCIKSTFIDRTNQTFNGIKVIQELDNSKIMGECIHCGSIKDYNKDTITQGGRQRCGCLISGIRSRIGQQYGILRITEELGKARVKCQCSDCNTIDEYFKQQVIERRALCSYCEVITNKKFKKLENKVINNVAVISYEYTGRDKKQ